MIGLNYNHHMMHRKICNGQAGLNLGRDAELSPIGGAVGWVERSETHHLPASTIDGFRCALPILLRVLSGGQRRVSAVPTIAAMIAVAMVGTLRFAHPTIRGVIACGR
jgi:hypothetical protein